MKPVYRKNYGKVPELLLMTRAVKDFVADEPIELVYFPTGSPDLNPTEEYWRQLKLALGNRYFGTCAEIRSAVWTALESISPPGIYQYLCL